MSSEDEKTDPEIKGIKKINVARASGIMLAGTMVSRLLGFVRAALLIALIGSIGANDAFQAANSLPNIIYNLLASSILSAVLVPQIVRALQRKNSDEFINRLLTLFTTGLLLLTLVCVALAPVFVTLFAAKLDPGWKQLAITFSYWSLPQVFFYGLYSLWGQFLNAKGSFGPYMWAPVVNNVVGIAGIFIFWRVLGTETDWAGDPSVWTGEPVVLLAGISTLGIVVQALILLIPLRRTGFKMRPVWGIRGHGLGEVSRTAIWAFSALCVAQLGFLAISNIAAAANGYASKHQVTIATTTAYNTAFTVYMIPQSMIVTSVVTAMFTSMSAMVAVGALSRLRTQFLNTQQGVSLITCLCAVLIVVLALPIMQFIMPTTPTASVQAFAQVLAVMALGIPFLGFFNLSQRLILAFADARSTFLVQIPMTICTLIVCGLTVLLLPVKYWVMGASAGMQLSYLVGSVLTIWHLHKKHLPLKFTAQLGRSLVTITLATLGAGCAGWLILHYWGPLAGSPSDPALVHMTGALSRVLVVTLVMTGLYLGLLLVWRCPALSLLAAPIWGKLSKGRPLPQILTYVPSEDQLTSNSQSPEGVSEQEAINSREDDPALATLGEAENAQTQVKTAIHPSETGNDSYVQPENELSKEDEDQVTSEHLEPEVTAISYNADGYVNLQSGMTLHFPGQKHFSVLNLNQRLAGEFLPEKDAWAVSDETGKPAELLVLQGKREKTREYYAQLQQVKAPGFQEFIWVSSDPVDAVLLQATPDLPLSEIVGSGMPAPVIHSLISQVSGGLSQLHEAGLAHGAIDPAHILVSADGKVLIRLDVADQNASADLTAAQTRDGQRVLELLYFLTSGNRDQFSKAKAGEKLLPPSKFHHGSDVDLDAVALAGAAMPSPRLCQAIWEQLGMGELGPVANWLTARDEQSQADGEKSPQVSAPTPEDPSAFADAPAASDSGDAPEDNNLNEEAKPIEEETSDTSETTSDSENAKENAEEVKPEDTTLAMEAATSARAIKPVLPPAAKIPGHRNQPYQESAKTQAIPLTEMQEMNLNPQEEKAGDGAWVPQAVSSQQARQGSRPQPPNFLGRLGSGKSASSVGQIPTLAALDSKMKTPEELGIDAEQSAQQSSPKKPKFSKNPKRAAKQKAKLAEKINRDAQKAARQAERRRQREQRRQDRISQLSPKDLEPVNVSRRLIVSSLVGMAIVLVFSVMVLVFWPRHNPPVAKPTTSQTQTQKVAPKPAPVTKPAEIAGVASIDAEGNDTEHPELADRMIDGDENTWWRSRFFRNPKLGDRSGFGVIVTFKEHANVSEIKLKTNAQGGKIEVRSLPESGLPRDGKVLATGTFSDTVNLKLNPKANTQALILWFPELPLDNTGNNRATISEIAVS
ncbi:MAG: polysaccharide biosynthesis C-terminal domain-containing protein [Varibaculum cambriense]|uniref:lipid II flippase MurJ n=1 Tax=Varibaculum cambriense TaxID=184870 RepID=UPI00241F29C1|nr:lipid II flippase MurJ [Varibaculum cambriense]MBS5972113.1 polysaccharide biosynthesis C-terminal domain-containing protein [Varibaculum cambriense]